MDAEILTALKATLEAYKDLIQKTDIINQRLVRAIKIIAGIMAATIIITVYAAFSFASSAPYPEQTPYQNQTE